MKLRKHEINNFGNRERERKKKNLNQIITIIKNGLENP